nr:DUF1799 domain-containing protein [Nitrosomonas aestuarii]
MEAARRNSEGENSQDCEVWEENWRSVLLFLLVQTQWVVAPMGGYVGLNYTGVQSAMWMSSIRKKERPGLFDDLRIIESEILKTINERNK